MGMQLGMTPPPANLYHLQALLRSLWSTKGRQRRSSQVSQRVVSCVKGDPDIGIMVADISPSRCDAGRHSRSVITRPCPHPVTTARLLAWLL